MAIGGPSPQTCRSPVRADPPSERGVTRAALQPRRAALTLWTTAGSGHSTLTPVEPHLELAGRWIIETIGGQPLVTERRRPTLSIAIGSIGVSADGNGIGAPFTIPAPGRISVTSPIMGTAIGCPPEDSAEDALMTKAMTLATAYRIEGDRLVLTGGPGMVARRPPSPDHQLAREYEACGNTLLGAYHEGPITLTIDDRTIRDMPVARRNTVQKVRT